MIPSTLPIAALLPALSTALGTHSLVVLSAEPGAGKTTAVPLHLLRELPRNGKIVVIEPRRIAVLGAAHYLAEQLGEPVGQQIGYAIRGERKASAATRVLFLTEGIFLRMLQEDPALSDVAVVLFDEFHERNLQSDLALAFCLQTQELLRPELRLLVMSATLDRAALQASWPEAAWLSSPGRVFPVNIRYLPGDSGERIEQRVQRALREILPEQPGDVLVFLPGRAEISRAEQLLQAMALNYSEPLEILPLHADVSLALQRRALSGATGGVRKIFLATSIAETSVTIPGVRVVIDSGLMRVPRYDPARGMQTLVTLPVSQASAAQRAGRAGRTAPGLCLRLWPEYQHLLPQAAPEIVESDLAPLALELACWGTKDPRELRFLDHPPLAALQEARLLLQKITAIDAQFLATSLGRQLARLGLHPRIGAMVLHAKQLGVGALGVELACVLEEAQSSKKFNDLDLSSRILGLRASAAHAAPRRQCERLCRTADIDYQPHDLELLGVLVGCAYPERLARRRGLQSGLQSGLHGQRYQMAQGSGAELPSGSLLARHEYLAIAHLDARSGDARVFSAEPVSRSQIDQYLSSLLTDELTLLWDPERAAVRASRQRKLGALVLSEQVAEPDAEHAEALLLQALQRAGLACLGWDTEAYALLERIRWMNQQAQWQLAMDEPALCARAAEWLFPFRSGNEYSLRLLSKIAPAQALQQCVGWDRWRELEQRAPERIVLPSGSQPRIRYQEGQRPVLAVPLQELFGQLETPSIDQGRVALTLELLSPARRPLQVTQDLASFWRSVYPELRPQMQARYPKHDWPLDPRTAPPSRGVRRRRAS